MTIEDLKKELSETNAISLGKSSQPEKVALKNQLFEETSWCPEDYSIATRIFVVMNDLEEVPKCVCGNECVPNKLNNKLGFSKFCSILCSQKFSRNRESNSIRDTLIKILSNDGRLIPKRCSEEYFKDHGVGDLIPYIVSTNPSASFGDCIKAIINSCDDPICKTCGGNVVEWDKKKKSWRSFCSHVCMHNDPMLSEKRKSIWTQETIDKAKVARETFYQENFGVSHNSQVAEISAKMKESIREALANRTDEDNLAKSESYRLSRMGETAKFVNDRDWVDDQYTTQEKSVLQISKEYSISEAAIKHAILRHEIPYTPERQYQQFVSNEECDLFGFIKSIKSDAIQTHRLNGKELDIFVPSMNLGIEYNGCYFHSTEFKDRNYHANKVSHFSDIGIRVVQIWSDSWLKYSDRTKAFLSNILAPRKPIGARKTTCREIDTLEYNKFLDRFHMQGSCGTGIKIGIFLGDELKSVMGFKRIPSNVSKEGFELVRFANDNIVGSFSKALKYFRKNYPGTIYSFADLETVDPTKNVYVFNGFVCRDRIKPDYKYFDRRVGERIHKFNFRKDRFSKLGIDIEGKTERELANEYGLLRCYDSGKICYVLE